MDSLPLSPWEAHTIRCLFDIFHIALITWSGSDISTESWKKNVLYREAIFRYCCREACRLSGLQPAILVSRVHRKAALLQNPGLASPSFLIRVCRINACTLSKRAFIFEQGWPFLCVCENRLYFSGLQTVRSWGLQRRNQTAVKVSIQIKTDLERNHLFWNSIPFEGHESFCLFYLVHTRTDQ